MPSYFIPTLDNTYIEQGETYFLTVSDQDFDHYDAWCYPFLNFGIADYSLVFYSTDTPWIISIDEI